MHALVRLIVVALLLGGCTAVRTVYNQADYLAAWRVDDYFDLTDAQKRQFRSAFGRVQAWHRAAELEPYAELLEGIDRRLARGPEMQDVDWLSEAVKLRARTLVQHGYREAAAFLATLSDAQVEAARRRFERDDRKFARAHGVGAPAAEQKRLRAKDYLETIEQWSGPLDRDQRERFPRLSDAQPLAAELRNSDRSRRQREFLALLAQRHAPQFPERLRDWLLDWNAGRPAAMDAELEAFQRAHRRMLLDVFAQLRPDQQHRVSARLRDYADAMRDLARDVRHQADTGALAPNATP
jgi:hypothetical protein